MNVGGVKVNVGVPVGGVNVSEGGLMVGGVKVPVGVPEGGVKVPLGGGGGMLPLETCKIMNR